MGDWKLKSFRGFKVNDPVSEAALIDFSSNSDFQMPYDYLDFVRSMNGGEGFIGDAFVQLYKVEELLEMNCGYKFQQFFPGFFLFGSELVARHLRSVLQRATQFIGCRLLVHLVMGLDWLIRSGSG